MFYVLVRARENLAEKANKRNLENALEALIGAIYLDSNYAEAKKFILNFWNNSFNRDATPPKDPISFLQEIVQSKTKLLPIYNSVQSGGCDHAPEFDCQLLINMGKAKNLKFGAKGKSKKEAQKQAAKLALEHLEKNPL